MQAQENSAYWAEAMFWVTATTLGLSVIGIVFVWTTFKETRNANELSKRAGRAILEPAFKLTAGNISPAPRIVISGRNIGETTAQNAVLRLVYANEIPPKLEVITKASNSLTIIAHEVTDFTIFEPKPSDAIGFYFFGTITYDRSFGDQHVTYFCFRVEQAIPDPSVTNRGILCSGHVSPPIGQKIHKLATG